MKYRTLGNTGLVVSSVALGTMQFGGGKAMGGLQQEETRAMIRFALDRGVNLIDTADVYSMGESESLIGTALEGIRNEVVLATKCRLPMSDNMLRSGATRVNIMRALEASLQRLKTDHIDLYQIHSWDLNTPIEETLRAMDDLVRQGKVRYIGLSNYQAWQAATALHLQERKGLEPYVTAQMYYSLVGRDLEDDFLSMAEYYNLGILVWSPLAGGFLSGKYDRQSPPPAGTRFAEAGQFIPFDLDQGYRIIDTLREVAKRHDATPARVALAWILSRGAISSVIVAARKNEHLEDNIKAADLELSNQDVAELDEVSARPIPYPRWMVLQHNIAEEERDRALNPERYADGIPWEDRRFAQWRSS
jgi:aryl-alcohol dehydrogenase-like predicted oxidoreductase